MKRDFDKLVTIDIYKDDKFIRFYFSDGEQVLIKFNSEQIISPEDRNIKINRITINNNKRV